MIWMYYEDYLVSTKEEIEEKINLTKTNNYNCVKIILLNTNEIFNSITEAAKKYNIKYPETITRYCKGKQKIAGRDPITNEPLVWMYYDEYLEKYSLVA